MSRILHTSTPALLANGAPGETEDEFVDRLARDLEELILAEGPETVAAFIAEPIMGAGGVVVPPRGYFPKMQEVLSRHDVLHDLRRGDLRLRPDGRSGGSQTFDIKPDSISMAKAITSAYCRCRRDRCRSRSTRPWSSESRKSACSRTASPMGASRGCAVAVKTLEIYERIDIAARGAGRPFVPGAFAPLGGHPLVGEARGVGLIGALELAPGKSTAGFAVPGKVAAKMAAEMLARGVIVRAIADSIAFCPPMIATEEEIDEIFAPVEAALDATHAWAKADGHLT